MAKLSRRDFLKMTAVAGGALAGPALVYKLFDDRSLMVSERRTMMGTAVHLQVVAESEAQGREALQAAFDAMARLVWVFDHRRPSSPLAALNAQGKLMHAPAEMRELLREALDYGHLTGGKFDVTVKPLLDAYRSGLDPGDAELAIVDYRRVYVDDEQITLGAPEMGVTLDAIAKGRVVDEGVQVLHTYGFDNVLVEAGGDLVGRGQDVAGKPWRVAVRHPRQEEAPAYIAAFSLHNGAVATSGDYMHAFAADRSLHHILDPQTGLSPPALAGATVLAPTATAADALSTALMLMGPDDGLALANRLPETEALIVTKELAIRRTVGFPTLS